LTTALDDTITSAAYTALVGTGGVTTAAINGGLGRDTLNSTIDTAARVTSLTTSGANGVAVTGVEVLNFTQTVGGNLNLGTNTNTDWTNFTVSATDLNAALTLTTNAASQTVTVNNTTAGGTGSTITLGAGLLSQTVTTGTPADTVNFDYATNGSSINTGAGNDTINIANNATTATFATALPTTTTMVINGGAGTADVLAFGDTLGASENINLQTYFTNGILVGIEKFTVTATNADDSTHAITMATGITALELNTNHANEIFNVTGTSAQIDALTSVVSGSATGEINLIISDAASVSFAGDTLTNVDVVNFGSTSAGSVTTGLSAIAVTQTGTGTAATTFTIGSAPVLTATDITTTNTAQTFTAVSTGTVTFNLPVATLNAISGVVTANGNAYDAGDITLVSPAAATTTLNLTGALTTATTVATVAHTFSSVLMNDADLVLTNARLDFINVGGVTADAVFSYGTGVAATSTRVTIPVIATEVGATQYSYSFVTDNAGTADQTLSITGFDVGASGDKLLLSNAANPIAASAVSKISTTGFGFSGAAQVAAGAEAAVLVLQASAFQVTGSLDQVGDAGAVEAAIIAAGLISNGGHADVSTYIALDNGTDTGIYRVILDATNGAVTIDTAAEITSVVLVATLVGVSDVGTLVGANFA
jgi:hypothetical protein